MEWSDVGYVLQAKKFGESSALVSILTKNHGRCSGLVKRAFSKSKRGMIEPGCYLNVKWSARLSGQLGQWQLEQLSNSVARLFDDRIGLLCIRSLADLCLRALPEGESHEALHTKFSLLMNAASNDILHEYALFEVALLKDLGFRLVLDRCAATGEKDELIYISPKSGQSVSKAAGKPYESKLFPLPDFLKNGHLSPDIKQIVQALTVTGYFLTKHVWPEQKGWHAMPESRDRLFQHLTRQLQSADDHKEKDAA